MRNIYNAESLRVSVLENRIWTGFTFDRGNVIAEFDKNNELTARYIRGYQLLAQRNSQGQTGYYLHNAHGDVTEIADENGNVLNSYSYDAFGITLSYTETVANRFRYAGQQYDQVTELYYLRARYYAPNIGRFIQEDPYRGDGLNLYVYVSNNPLRYIDPSGLCKDEGGESSFWSATGNFFGGIWDGAKDTVSGLWYVATHGDEVINTVADIFESNEAMYQAGKAIYSSVRNYVETNIINGNANTRARAAGRIVFEVGTAIIGTKGLDKVDKISDAGRAVRYADDVARYVDDVSRYSDDVSRGIKKINLQQFANATNLQKYSKPSLWERLTTIKLSIDRLVPNPLDPFTDPKIGPSSKALSKYLKYISQNGKIDKPIIVKKLTTGMYEIQNGHHRWLAARKMGLKILPVEVIK